MRPQFIVLVALLLLATNSETAVGQSESRIISDFVVVSDETTNLSATYIADQTSGAIYLLTSPIASAAAPNELKLANFSEFFLNPSELSAPSAITHHNGKLVVADSRQRAVFEIDTTTKSLSLLFKTQQATTLTRIAVSPSGRVAVSTSSGQILFYDRSGKLSPLKQQFDNPARLIFAGEDLLLLDKQGRIFLVPSASTDAAPAITQVQIPTKVTGNMPRILDFAFLNGVYYLVGEKQVYAYLRSKAVTVPLINRPTEAISLTAISANKREVVIKDQAKEALWKMQRPVAVTATFDTSVGQSLVLLYQYLNSKKALPFKELTARRNYESLKELLLEQKIILPEGAEMTQQLTELICQFNKGLCSTPQAKTSMFDQRVRKGERIVLPDMPYREVVGYETKRLVNQSVQDYLDRTFKFNRDIRAQFTPNVLWQLYDQKSQTLESRLQTNLPGALLASPPQGSVPPGTILKIAADQDRIVSSLSKCEIDLRYSTKSVNLPKNIKSSVHGQVAITQLPRNSVQSATTRKLKQLEIDEVQFEVDEPVLEQGDPKAVGLAFSSTGITRHGATAAMAGSAPGHAIARFARESRDCLVEIMDSTTYLVIDALKVKRGRYKIFRNRSLLHLTQTEIEELQLLGKPDPSGEWSLIVDAPYYVGYRLSKWSDPSVLESPMLRVEEFASELRPGGTQDILALRDTAFVLPYVSQWEVTFLISESELTDEASDFNKLKSTQKFTALRAEETTRVAGSLKFASYQERHEPLFEVVTRDRARLKREINFPTFNRDLPIALGIGEKRCSVDKNHRDFKDEQGGSAWIDEVSPEPDSCAQPNRETTRKTKPASQMEETDHGTHIAGLIAARSNSIAPGLVPYAKLFLVDATSAATLNSSITRAVERDVSIFNFSFGFVDDSPDLRKAISTRWSDRLFIVAVDNSGVDLEYSRKPPVTWLDNIHDNMIGVASSIAAGGTQYVLGDWLSMRGLAKGSSYGKKYVHLVAPGHAIYSTVSGNDYGEATGTSHAAPQVTATAGLLFSSAEINEPARIKARLIYTSDWFEQLRGKVWGGFLNARRAVWEPKRNLVITQSEREITRAITLDPDAKATMKIKPEAQLYGPESEVALTEGRDVPFADILRITLLPNNFYRVIYLDVDRKMKIVLNAQISGKFPCLKMDELKDGAFVASKCFEYGLEATQVYDYIGQTPRKVLFTP